MFHSLPLLHLKGYQPYSFSYRFLKVSTVFRHSFRLLFWKMSQNDNIASSGRMSFARATEFGQPLLFPLLLIKTFAVDILSIIYFKNNLRFDYKNIWHVSVDITETIWNLSALSSGFFYLPLFRGIQLLVATIPPQESPGPPQESLVRDETRIFLPAKPSLTTLGQLCVAPRTSRSRPVTTEPGREPRVSGGAAGAAVQPP